MDNKVSQVSFHGILRNKVSISKKNNSQFVKNPAYFVELVDSDINDKLLLYDLSRNWQYSYVNLICKGKFTYPQKKSKVFILTEQNKDFEKLDYKKVLGITELIDVVKNDTEGIKYIDFLQVNPDYIPKRVNKGFFQNLLSKLFGKNEQELQKYKYIGSRILDCIKKYDKNVPIELVSANYSKGFYKKNGFNVLSDLDRYGFECHVRWVPKDYNKKNYLV